MHPFLYPVRSPMGKERRKEHRQRRILRLRKITIQKERRKLSRRIPHRELRKLRPSLLLRISVPGFTKISFITSTSVLSVLVNWVESHVFGRVGCAGRFFIRVASGNGRGTRGLQRRMLCVDSRRIPPERLLLLARGVAPAVTLRRRSSLRHTLVGVKRKSTHVHYLACLPIHVDRLARGLVRGVRIHAIRFVTRVPVHHVRPWVPRKTVSVVGILPPSDVRTRTMRMGGVVVRSVATCCRVVSILAIDRVTRVCVVRVMSKSRHVAIAVAWRRKCYAVPKTRRWIVRGCVMITKPIVGQVVSAVESFAVVLLIVVSIFVRRAAILKMHNLHTVRSRLMWCLTAPVVRRR